MKSNDENIQLALALQATLDANLYEQFLTDLEELHINEELAQFLREIMEDEDNK